MAKQFFKVDIGLAERYGLGEAALVGFLFNFSKVAQKDEHGYFMVETGWIAHKLGISKKTLLRRVSSAADHKLINYKPGANQNSKPKFKIF